MGIKPRSVVFLVPGFPPHEQDAQCLPSVQNVIAAFAGLHPEVETHVVAFQYPFAARTYRWKQVTVHALGGRNRRGAWKGHTWLRAALAFLPVARRTRVCVVHSFWLGECALVGQGLARLARARHVASIAGQDALPQNPYLRWLALDAMTLTAGSAFAAGVFGQHTGRGVDRVVPLGLDTAHLRTLPSPDVRDIDLLGVGALIPLKGYLAFVDLVARLVPAHPGLTACLIGDGPERPALERRIREAGLEAHLWLTGALPRDEVFRYMRRSRIFVHPAAYEAQGYVLLEALFAGLHVVCFETGYAPRSERLIRCATARQMQAVLAGLLTRPLDHTPAPVPTAADTARAFAACYGPPFGHPAP